MDFSGNLAIVAGVISLGLWDLYVSQLFSHIRNGCNRVAGAGAGYA
jgi:hypothetical protein